MRNLLDTRLHKEDIAPLEQIKEATIEKNFLYAKLWRMITDEQPQEEGESGRGDTRHFHMSIEKLLAHAEEADRQRLVSESKLGYKIDKFFSGIKDIEFFNLVRPNKEESGAEENIRVTKSIKRFIENGYVRDATTEAARQLMNIMIDTAHQVKALEDKLDEVRRYLRKIRSQLNAIGGISVIKSIEIEMPNEEALKKYQSDNSEILRLLKRLRDEYETRERTSIGSGLFAIAEDEHVDKEELAADKRLLDIFTALDGKLEDTRREKLTLEDCFDIRFRVVENNEDSGWQSSLNGIGSEGTDALVKMLINIAFLDILKKERLSKARVHCMIDEIGKLSSVYFKEVMDFGGKRGIVFVSALPEKMLVTSHRSTYKLEKVGKRNVTVPTLIVHREDEDEFEEVSDE